VDVEMQCGFEGPPPAVWVLFPLPHGRGLVVAFAQGKLRRLSFAPTGRAACEGHQNMPLIRLSTGDASALLPG
jgi:hypothetical protein